MSTNPIYFQLERSGVASQPHTWKVYKTSGNTKLAYGENYVNRQDAINAVNVVKGGQVTYHVFEDRNKRGQWYFHIKARNGEILARSAYWYRSQTDAQTAANLVKNNASTAPFYEATAA